MEVEKLRHKLGISSSSYYNRAKGYGAVDAFEFKRLKMSLKSRTPTPSARMR